MYSKVIKALFMMIIFGAILVSTAFGADDNLAARLVTADIPSPSLKGNLLGTPDVQKAYIYLPPSYFRSENRYPVVYFFNGYADDPEVNGMLGPTLDRMIQQKTIKEFILVSVNGVNKLGGSFLVNSPVTGNWEDYAVNDVVGAIDRNYRTLPKASSRAIMGFSMGGFAAVNLSLRHPDVYSVVYALCPGLFDQTGLKDAMSLTAWDPQFKAAYGAAFAPNPDKPYPYADIPKMDGSAEDNIIRDKWENGFGNLPSKLGEYRKKSDRLKAIRLEFAVADMFRWITDGTQYFSRKLDEAKIPHDIITSYGAHMWNAALFEKDAFPFLAKNLENK